MLSLLAAIFFLYMVSRVIKTLTGCLLLFILLCILLVLLKTLNVWTSPDYAGMPF